jgi:flagellar FliJ protein
MILSIDNHPDGVQLQAKYRPSSSSDKPAATLSKAEMKRARQMEGRAANLKRRIATMNHLIPECDRIVADLDREIRIEEDRTKIHDPAHSAYSTYAKATALRRDNLRRSADELTAHLAEAEKALREFGEERKELNGAHFL